jgi:hypothetical protein
VNVNVVKMEAEAERVMAQEKAIIVVRTLLVRHRQSTSLLRNANERIASCEKIMARGPGELKFLEKTLAFWIRERNYHQKMLAECSSHDAETRAVMPVHDIQVAIDES